ncbi:HNH/ENDO VII family nuclease [Enterobacter cloacae]
MATGRAPVGYYGNAVNLNHMLQTQDSPIAEMSQTFHKTNHRIIHINPNTIPSGIDLYLIHGVKNIGQTERVISYEQRRISRAF